MSVDWKSMDETPEQGRSVWCACIRGARRVVEFGYSSAEGFRTDEGFEIDSVVRWAYAEEIPDFPDGVEL